MANFTEEQFEAALGSFLKLVSNPEKPEVKPEPKAELSEADIEAAVQRRLEELTSKQKVEEPSVEEEEVKPQNDSLSDKEIRLINKTLKADLASKGIDGDLVDSLVEFIDYDKLRDEEGEASDEIVETLATTLSNIALRKPPRGGSDDHDILNPNKGGLSKYLPQNNK